jgi:hypothetical protein
LVVFRSIDPAWNDQNLREVSCHVNSPLFFAHIRAAIGSAVQQTNCHRSAMAGGCSTSGPRLICPSWSCASATDAPNLDDVVPLAGMFRALVIRETAVSIAGSPPVPARPELLKAATLPTGPDRRSGWPAIAAEDRRFGLPYL